MHKKFPKFFVFLDKYNSEIFKNKNINISVIYRNYKDRNRENQLIKIAKACKRNRYQLFVSNDLKLAHKVKADGIYIPSFNKRGKFSNLGKKNIVILGSAHNQKEIQIKISQISSLYKYYSQREIIIMAHGNVQIYYLQKILWVFYQEKHV